VLGADGALDDGGLRDPERLGGFADRLDDLGVQGE
jgi:hypothetical protein